ncbi:MAG: hypothetical protein H7255_14570 [Ramlibacter sp.]|nr:hypothetical protein [Ramlibacter sp.]
MPQPNLSPELLALLQAQNTAGTSGWNPYGSVDQGGMRYDPNLSRGTGETGLGNDQFNGYFGSDPTKQAVGDSYSNYDKQGVHTGDGLIKPGTSISDFLMPLLGAVGMAAFLPGGALGGMFGGTGAAAGVAGESGSLAGEVLSKAALDGTTAFGANSVPGAFDLASLGGGGLGDAASYNFSMGPEALETMPYQSPIEGLSGGSAPEFNYGASSGSGAGGAGAGAGAGGGGSGGTLSKAALDGTNAFGANSVPGAFDLASVGGGTSWLDSLGGVKNLLGLGATALGAFTGSQGQGGGTATQTRDLPEWLKPAAQKGINYAGTLLDQQMTPGYLAGFDKMRAKGSTLLDTPQQGNLYAKFFPGA